MLLQKVKYHKLPLLSGLLYGASWPIFEWLNLSFLAWFAFVPLFLFLEQNHGEFWKSMFGSYLAMVIFGCFSAGWLFNFPDSKWQITIIFLMEEFWFFVPFLLFYPIQRKLNFDKALWLFPFIWMLWEWTYLHLEFTMGTHLSAYSQSSNIWFIQYIDLTGMWGVSFWLMLFNVLIFKIYRQTGSSLKNKHFYRKVTPVFGFMLGIPLIYAIWAFSAYETPKNSQLIEVSLVPTYFLPEFLNDPNNGVSVVEQTLHRTDSLAFNRAEVNQYSDLYVWPETGISYHLGVSNLNDLLSEAVADWKGALLTGCKGVSGNTEDKRKYVSGVLLSHKAKESAYHHKTVLTPGNEDLPYRSVFEQLNLLSSAEADSLFFTAGTESEAIPLLTKDNRSFRLGVSLCFEQWYPSHWAALARNGADFYAHLAGEGWYGNVGFQAFMANVSRMRSIENRRQTTRCANVGKTLFIDQMGRTAQSEEKTLEIITGKLHKLETITLYTKYPHWFPIAVGLGLLIFSIFIFKLG